MNHFIKTCLTIASGLCAIGLVLVIIGGIFGGFNQAAGITVNGVLSYPGFIENIEMLNNSTADYPAAAKTGTVEKNSSNTNNADNDEISQAEDFFKEGKASDGYYEDDAVCDRNEISYISMDIGACELTVCEWDGNTYKIVGENTPGLKCYAQGNTLYLKSSNNYFNPAKRHLVTLFVPEKVKLDNVMIDLGAGKGIVTGIKADEYEIDLGAGEIICRDIKAEDMNIDVGAGSASFKDCITDDLEMDIGAGSMTYEGDVNGNIYASCAMGSVEASINGDYQEYDYNIDVTAGNIEILQQGDKLVSFEGLSSRKINNDAEKKMSLDCTMGSMSIRFQ